METYKAKHNKAKGTLRIISRGDRQGYLIEDWSHCNKADREFLIDSAILDWHMNPEYKIDGKMIEIIN